MYAWLAWSCASLSARCRAVYCPHVRPKCQGISCVKHERLPQPRQMTIGAAAGECYEHNNKPGFGAVRHLHFREPGPSRTLDSCTKQNLVPFPTSCVATGFHTFKSQIQSTGAYIHSADLFTAHRSKHALFPLAPAKISAYSITFLHSGSGQVNVVNPRVLTA